jgi:Holliday junction resolvase
MANRNRTAGNNFERLIVNELKGQNFEDVVTSRAESRNMDNKGVDIFGDSLPVHIQCKCSKSYPKNHDLLTSELLPTDKPTVVFHRLVKKANTRFVTQGDYVTMKKEDFYKLLGNGEEIKTTTK